MSDNESLAGTLPVCSPTDPPRRKADTAKWKQQHKDKASTLPLNLISTSNQQKVSNNYLTACELTNDLLSMQGGIQAPKYRTRLFRVRNFVLEIPDFHGCCSGRLGFCPET